MAAPTTLGEEYARATAAEQALSDRLAKLEPQPPPLAFGMTIADGEILKGNRDWFAAETTGVADHVDFFVDAKLYWPEKTAPWGGVLDSRTLQDGQHILTATMYDALARPVTHVITVTVANVVVVPPPPPPPATRRVGSADIDTKDNIGLGTAHNGDVAIRLKKHGTGPVTGFRWQSRYGPGGYSGGTGGRLRATCRLDLAGAALASTTFSPGTNGGKADAAFPTTMFDAPTPDVPDGSIYYIVLENVDQSQAANWVSMNVLLHYSGSNAEPQTQRQPTIDDADYAVLVNTGSGWNVRPRTTANIDVLPGHDGLAYTQCLTQYWQAIGGRATGLDQNNKVVTRGASSGNQIRQTFTLETAGTYRTIKVRVRRDHGSAPLEIVLERLDGTVIVRGTVVGTGIPTTGSGGDNAGQWWAVLNLATAVSLQPGSYRIRLATSADTAYTLTPVRKAVVDNVTGSDWGSYMVPGMAEYSVSNATSWLGMYVSVKNQTDAAFALLP